MSKSLHGFPPLESPGAVSLILGSFPSEASLALGQYYGHAQNRFWRMLAPIAGYDVDADYPARVVAAGRAGIAIWDVLASCVRAGSLDSAIVRGSEVPNDIGELLARHPGIRRILLNGRKAASAFSEHIVPEGFWPDLGVNVCVLPSTSPANAAVPLPELQRVWRAGLSS